MTNRDWENQWLGNVWSVVLVNKTAPQNISHCLWEGLRNVFVKMKDSSSCWRGLCPFPSAPQMISAEPDQHFVKKAPQPDERRRIMTPCWSQGSRSSMVIPHPAMPCSLPTLSRAMPGCPSSSESLCFHPSAWNLPLLTALWEKLPSCLAKGLRANLLSWRKPLSPGCLRFQCSCGINMLGLMFSPWLLKGQNGSILNL